MSGGAFDWLFYKKKIASLRFSDKYFIFMTIIIIMSLKVYLIFLMIIFTQIHLQNKEHKHARQSKDRCKATLVLSLS